MVIEDSQARVASIWLLLYYRLLLWLWCF